MKHLTFSLFLFIVPTIPALALSTSPAFQADETTRNREWAREAAKAEKDPATEFQKRCFPEKNICINAYITHDGTNIRTLREETDLSGHVAVRGVCEEKNDLLSCYNWDTGEVMMTAQRMFGRWMVNRQ